MRIPLIKPYINQQVRNRVSEVLDSGYLTEGIVTKEFETKFKEYIECDYTIAVTSCTTGLEIALRALGVGEGDEVIVPDYTYPATASVVAILGAKAVIVDVDKKTMLIDYEAIEKAITQKTKAIIPVSLFGNPLDYDVLNKIKSKYNLFILEDAACSIGAEYKGLKVGNQADITVFSLHPRKFITTGEGGMITTNNKKWAEWMNSYKHFGMDMQNKNREGVQFKIIGINYKLSNILSAIGLEQLCVIDELITRRKKLAENYIKLLQAIPDIDLPKVTPEGIHSYQSFCVFVKNRDKIMRDMRSEGIEVQIGTYALHLHEAYQESDFVSLKSPFDGSKYAFKNCLTLPLFHELTFAEQDSVVKHLVKYLS